MDDGDPIAYYALERGTAIASSDGVELGTVERVIDNPREHIFDSPRKLLAHRPNHIQLPIR